MRAVMVATLAVLAGCTHATSPAIAPAETPSALGGVTGPSALPPDAPMSRAESAIARHLAGELSEQGLTLDYLDCPQLTKKTPQTVVCTAHVAGVLAEVQVRLTGSARAGIAFDARLSAGIVATSSLVRRLAAEGYREIDCGERSAYPALVGRQIVCSARKDESQRYLVATITTDHGTVKISDF